MNTLLRRMVMLLWAPFVVFCYIMEGLADGYHTHWLPMWRDGEYTPKSRR